jgi:hypothetical protein
MTDQAVYLYRAVVANPAALPAALNGTFAPWYGNAFGGSYVTPQDPVTGNLEQFTTMFGAATAPSAIVAGQMAMSVMAVQVTTDINNQVWELQPSSSIDELTLEAVGSNLKGLPVGASFLMLREPTSGASSPVYGVIDDDALVTLSAIQSIASLTYGFNGATYDKQRSQGNNADAVAAIALGVLAQASYTYAFNGTTFDRVKTGSAANLSAATQPQTMMVTGPGNWAITHTPAANTVATITRAAGGAGVRHICNSISGSVIVGASQTPGAAVQLSLRDGASGAGTILWSQTINCTALGNAFINLSGLNIPGSANTAMTLEFSAAPGAANFESVALTGHDVI